MVDVEATICALMPRKLRDRTVLIARRISWVYGGLDEGVTVARAGS